MTALRALALLLLASTSAAHHAQSTALSPDRIAILHLVDDVWFFQDMAATALRNKARYAARHHYELITHIPHGSTGLWKPSDAAPDAACARRHDPGCFVPANADFALNKSRAPTFGKLALMSAACVGRDDYWLLWADADALVVNQSIPLTDIVDDGYDLMLTRDWSMINAGVLLWRCSAWGTALLRTVYDAPDFDKALALDQSALQSHLAALPRGESAAHVKYLPKHTINVYTEEYRAGDFLVHMAGKIYEANITGAEAIARQFDLLAQTDRAEIADAFLSSNVLLGPYSGTCVVKSGDERPCERPDDRRLFLDKKVGWMSEGDRYRHAEMRRGVAWDDAVAAEARKVVRERAGAEACAAAAR